MVDIIIVLGAIAAFIPALQGLGVDTRIFGRGAPVSADTVGRAIPKWRWWLVLIIASLALVGTIYNTLNTSRSPSEVVHFPKTDIEHLKYVHGKHYVNEEVRVDGIHFDSCTFDNVTLTYDGTDVVASSNSRFNNVRIKTNSDPVSVTVSMLKLFGFIKPGIPVLDKDEKPLNSMPGAEQIH